MSSNYRIPHEGGFVYPLLHKFFLYEFCRTAANRLHTLSLISIKTITRLEGGYAVALFFCPSRRQNIGGPGPSPGAASGPSGGPGPPAPCAPLPGLCAGLLRCARPCPPPPGFAPPRRPLPLGFASLAAGPALAVRGFGPRPGPPGRFRAAPLRPSLRWPRPVGAGPRPSLGASLPPAAAPAPPPFPVGLGRRARFASPARVLRLALRPRGLLLSALLCSWRGAAPCAAPALAGPPLPARPCGAASWPLRGPPAL